MSTTRDLARVGSRLGGEERPFKAALRASASNPIDDVGSPEWIEHVAGQVYAERERGDPADAKEFVETFLSVYDLKSLSDINDLMGRERYERQNYEGQLAFVDA